MSTLTFAETHNLAAFLEKPTESAGFEEIIDFLNAHTINYALTVNLTIYDSCIKQFWTTAKTKTVNEVIQIQALVDKKKVVITEASIRSDLQLEDNKGVECLPTATIFAELKKMGYEKLSQKLTFYKAYFSPQWKFLIHTILQCINAKTTAWNEFSSTIASAIICLATNQKFNFSKYILDHMVKNLEGGVKFLMYPRFVQVFLDKQVEGMSKHKGIYVTPSHTKKVFANMRRQGKDFSGRNTPLFPTMMVQAQQQEGESSAMPTDTQHTPIHTQPSTSQPPQKQKSQKSKKKSTGLSQLRGSADNVEDTTVPQHSNDPLQSGEDSMKLTELMEICTSLQQRVIDLENTKTTQAMEIENLKRRVKSLEKKKKSKPHKLTRLRKVSSSFRIHSSDDEANLGAQEDASKQGRSIEDIDRDTEVTLVDETQDVDAEMFDTSILDVSTVETNVTTASTTTTIVDELTLAQTLIEIKAAKPKAITTAAIIVTTVVTRPKARRVIVQEPSEFRTTTSPSQSTQLPQAKDKGKAKLVEFEKPMKKKDQIMIDEELARKLEAEELKAVRIEEEKSQQVKEANVSWDNVQAMIDANRLLAERL
ncbi:hypothetical protein Tco_0855201 [Tanacetum coccineum]